MYAPGKQASSGRNLGLSPTRPQSGNLPADVLRIGGKGDRPLGDAELSAIGRWLGLPFTPKALALAGIEVFQYAVKKCKAVTAVPLEATDIHSHCRQKRARARGATSPSLSYYNWC